MKQYQDLLKDILHNGQVKADRTGTGTISVFGRQMRFDLKEGFPLLTTKRVFVKGVIAELLWFLEGSTDNKRLNELGTSIWDEWALDDGDLGPIYGKQWRSWPTPDVEAAKARLQAALTIIDEAVSKGNLETVGTLRSLVRHTLEEDLTKTHDQIAAAIKTLRTKPNSRRILVSAWNPAVLPSENLTPHENVTLGKAALPACHTMFQLITEELTLAERLALAGMTDIRTSQPEEYVHEDLTERGIPTRKLSCQLTQRSADTFIGLPFNIASYALLTELIAQAVDMAPGELVWVGGDCHLYLDHLQQTKELLSRKPRALPKLVLNKAIKDIDEFTMDDIEVVHYDPYPPIAAPVSV